jgi:hypothetical protein
LPLGRMPAAGLAPGTPRGTFRGIALRTFGGRILGVLEFPLVP